MTNKFMEVATVGQNVLAEVERAVVGKRSSLEMIMAATLAGGHVLLEDFPGLGKTLIARSFSTALGLDFKRIQFTPDLLPGDITGGYVLDRSTNHFELRQGPIFTNVALADEINRASPKTQSALLEAMQEGQVTLEGKTMDLPKPFLVLATQNPIEYEGTFPLPEAQLDRFMIKLSMGYPSIAEEREILNRRHARKQEEVELKAVTSGEELLKLRQAIETIHVEPDLEDYIVRIVHETRRDRRVAVGASPRASLAFLKMARAHAALSGRDFILPDDIKRYAVPILTHRIILLPEYWVARDISGEVIIDVLKKIPVPVAK
ncbi:MAG: MoxR family ATPase [Anaerolineales bacterium]|nr:MoxR family ATPase [Anaerolineales bacterium]MCB9145488.1 MoxR family ATPase [Anaerolineales bacterium]